MNMKRHIAWMIVATVGVSTLLSTGGCTDWSQARKWPRQHKFQGRAVQLFQRNLTGDHDAEDVARGQQPARFETYYAYIDPDGKEVRHGKSTWWYSDGKRKSITTFVDGERQDTTKYYPDGTIREKTTRDLGGEKIVFYDRRGKVIGRQMYDKGSRKLTCFMDGKIVTLDDFMAKIGREVYGQTRIQP